MSTITLDVELLPDVPTTGQKPGWLLNQSSFAVLVLDVRGHSESARMPLHHLYCMMRHQIGDAW